MTWAIAARLWWLVRWLGHDAVTVLDGGWQAWQAAQQPTSSEIPQFEPRTFIPRSRPEMSISAEQLLAIHDQPETRLIDSRALARYRGEQEPIDPVAGHIPHAICRPFGDNLDRSKHFRPRSELRERFTEALGALPPSSAVFYCGSGVTGAHNILAMTHAGFDGAVLYAGSWSDWITDPTRPVVTGETTLPPIQTRAQ